MKIKFCSKFLFLVAITYNLHPATLFSGDFSASAKGTTTAGFLKLGASARPAALGEAYTAMADEADAVYWNPAALNLVRGRSASFTHALYVESTAFDYAAYAQKLSPTCALGMSIQYFSAGSLTETDITGTDIGTFSPNDAAATLGYAHEFSGYSFGLSLKYINTSVIESAQTFAADAGFLTPGYWDGRLRLGASVSNAGGTLTFEEESERLPLIARLGSALKLSEKWMAGIDFGFPIDNDPFIALGTEYTLPINQSSSLRGRLGANSRTWGDIDGLSGISTGLGFEYGKFGVDYALLPFGDLGWTHRFSLSWNF
ncbi:MAG: PorV/PorQ family protein [Elusimicrobia bacterium]|nr:PorV/PorQ family protein [Elusimicrobiota bacterium]